MSALPRILLVDDEEGIRKVLGLSLADRGFKVHTAENAEKALALFRELKPPIVLTDIKMPGMDGLELLRTIKAEIRSSGDHDAEVILITGHGDIGLAIQGIKLDATDFVTKPISDDALDIALARAKERLDMRRAIREHTQGLERLVEQKTRELLAAERLAAVGQTVAGLSHAIKNLASGLEGSIFLLGKGLELDRRTYLEQGWEMLKANVEKIKNLSLEMLRFAKPEDLKPAPCDPALPAREVTELLQLKAKAAGVELSLAAPENMAPVVLDAEVLHRCLMNLVGNALDACQAAGFGPETPGGRARLTVEPQPGGGVRYSVSDNGCGLTEEAKSRLFTAFFSTKGEGGSGLGLMTTKKIVEAHGGSIAVASANGTGTTFSIVIPGRGELSR
ncbi:MAG: hybrid sensor histidine kinase/response regulator [Deltaproteobacteria bacterium HGW-Deltaproteobacteria-8]|jgi:signal transduction histidine kinase|nr:MAG: hybrid sensor histidine kinase/response regulator [Deltaproteobacteria bacterium HGW-Deltaproteobacteria-8]